MSGIPGWDRGQTYSCQSPLWRPLTCVDFQTLVELVGKPYPAQEKEEKGGTIQIYIPIIKDKKDLAGQKANLEYKCDSFINFSEVYLIRRRKL